MVNQENKRSEGPKGYQHTPPKNEKMNVSQMQLRGPRGPGGPGGRGAPVQKARDSKSTIKRLLQYFRSSIRYLILLFIIMIPATVLAVYIPLLQGDLIDEITNRTNLINKTIIIMAICALVYCVLVFIQGYISAFLTVKTVKKMRNDLFEKVVNLPIKYIDTHAHGDIMSRMVNDIDSVSNTISQSITSVISGILLIFGTITAMLFKSWQLTLVSLVVVFISLTLVKTLSKSMKKHYRKRQKALGNLNGVGEEMITGCRTVAGYNYQNSAMEEFNSYSTELKNHGIKSDILSGVIPPLMGVSNNIGFVLICIVGGLLAMQSNAVVTIGTISAFTILSKQFSRPINEIASLWGQIQNAVAGAERVFEIFDEKQEVNEGSEEFPKKNLDISFENVNFSYVKGKKIINDFSLNVKPGQKIALVGATGSGKTTVVNLLMRFYDIDSGSIKIDGINIKDIELDELRKNIGIVLQDTVLFKDTMENNINYSNKEASIEEIIEASKVANCDYFISRFPEKYKSLCSSGGSNLSQGQRQLLTIARAILADPKILILDEATSSVDTRTEKYIQDAMVSLMKDRTSLIIAHRLSTIVDSDLIVVLDQGNILEMGNHNELLDTKGKYYELYQTQFKGQEI